MCAVVTENTETNVRDTGQVSRCSLVQLIIIVTCGDCKYYRYLTITQQSQTNVHEILSLTLISNKKRTSSMSLNVNYLVHQQHQMFNVQCFVSPGCDTTDQNGAQFEDALRRLNALETKLASQVFIRSDDSCDDLVAGAGGYIRAEEAVGPGQSGQSLAQHIQTLPSQEEPQNIEGDNLILLINCLNCLDISCCIVKKNNCWESLVE